MGIGQRREHWRKALPGVADDMIYGVDVPTLTRAILLAKENQVSCKKETECRRQRTPEIMECWNIGMNNKNLSFG